MFILVIKFCKTSGTEYLKALANIGRLKLR